MISLLATRPTNGSTTSLTSTRTRWLHRTGRDRLRLGLLKHRLRLGLVGLLRRKLLRLRRKRLDHLRLRLGRKLLDRRSLRSFRGCLSEASGLTELEAGEAIGMVSHRRHPSRRRPSRPCRRLRHPATHLIRS